ncbi:MAG: ATP-binding cassette domain-containing protein [Planctomycetaceae bacterium]|nr:ATP-binding cassette domain-containing protein [Planctomycetaceae bacterium]
MSLQPNKLPFIVSASNSNKIKNKAVTKAKVPAKNSATKSGNSCATDKNNQKNHTPNNEPEISWLSIIEAHEHNLKGINVSFPIGAFSVVTGVSGSGKSSLVYDVIWKSLAKILHRNTNETPGKVKAINGIENLNKVISVNQQPIGQTPNSNPATYTGMFDLIRELFAKLPDAKLRGYTARRFSFNTPDGRCEKCEGAGQIKIEMHFLPDVWITCDACNGKRYDRQTLDIKYHGYSIADILEMTCADALKLFSNIPRIKKTLQLLCDVGLDYLALGQSAPTLSGGESQRIKLTSELTRPDTGRTLYLLDEPTTGLHFDDMNKLLHVIHRLVDLGNTVIVIEHNLDIIKNADWIVDLGPEAGDSGGYLLFEGTPEELISSGVSSHTADALAPVLKNGCYQERVPFELADLSDLQDDEINISIDEIGIDTEMPWEKDGMKWHTQERIDRNGVKIRWDGNILREIVKRIEATGQFTPTNWNHRSIVEIFSEKKSLGWFMQAITSNEWFLIVKFKTAGGTFKRDQLIESLALKPFSEIGEIPLYNADSRVKLQRQTMQWQEIEMMLYSFNEINCPQFYDFLDKAIRGFSQFTKPPAKNQEDYLPWHVLGEKWHLLQRGFERDEKIVWQPSLLAEIFNILREISPNAEIIWTNKTHVEMYCNEKRKGELAENNSSVQRIPWVIVWTKRCEEISLEIFVAKNTVAMERIENIGNKRSIKFCDDYDVVRLDFTNETDLQKTELKQLLTETI